MPRLVEAVRDSGQVVTWVCDPMHGNTECVANFKTRRYDRIRAEVPFQPDLSCLRVFPAAASSWPTSCTTDLFLHRSAFAGRPALHPTSCLKIEASSDYHTWIAAEQLVRLSCLAQA